MYFGNLLYVAIIEFKLTYEAAFIPVTDNLILSSHSHFSFFIKLPTEFQPQRIHMGGRWRKSKTRRSPSSPQIHQKYIYTWNCSYREYIWGIDITPQFVSKFSSSSLPILSFQNSEEVLKFSLSSLRWENCSSQFIPHSGLWRQFKIRTPLGFPHNMQSHILRIPKIFYSIKTGLLLIKSAL